MLKYTGTNCCVLQAWTWNGLHLQRFPSRVHPIAGTAILNRWVIKFRINEENYDVINMHCRLS